ncbi:MAG: 1-hydroxycarotenoid 3,4-desaturase CrtD [Pseudomonadota bacterium]
MKNNVVVVGAGIGGLTASLELVSRGFDVSLIEQHDQPGGKMREVATSSGGVDSGPTVFTMRWVFDALMDKLGTTLDDIVDLQQADCLARHSWLDGSSLDLFADVDRSIEAIRDFAGQSDAQAYRKFTDKTARVFDTLDAGFMQTQRPTLAGLTVNVGLRHPRRLLETKPFVSLWDELGRVFTDPRLRQLFARYATYCGSSPMASPATLMLIAHAEQAGVWAVKGGMQRFADALAKLAAERGVSVRLGERVDEIRLRRGKVQGVLLESGESIDAAAVVFNGDINALSAGLLGDALTRAVPDRRKEARSLSALTWSLSARASGFPLQYHTVFFGGDYRAEFAAIFDQQQVCDEPTLYVCAQDRPMTGSDIGPQRGDESTERLFVLMNAPPRRLSNDEISVFEDRVFGLLNRHGLHIDTAEATLTAPQDFAVRFPGSEGAIYGWPTHGWAGSFRRGGSRSKQPGLYFAGGTVHPGPGVPMTALSGRLAAESIAQDLAGSVR